MQQVKPQPTATFVVPQTLKDFNTHLARLGLPCLEQTAFTALRAREPRDRLVDALRRAQATVTGWMIPQYGNSSTSSKPS